MNEIQNNEYQVMLMMASRDLARKNAQRSAEEIRQSLTDLKNRPANERQFLCNLLKNAAEQAAYTSSVVLPVNTHQRT